MRETSIKTRLSEIYKPIPNLSGTIYKLKGKILKESSAQVAPFLKYIFQKSLETSKLPEDWRSCPNNYCPVSLTSVVCKVLEHIVCSNMMNHLDAHGLITNRQHAFHKGHSCTTQLCSVIRDWSKAIDQGIQTDVFILEFAKAFDSVPHKHLKAKLFH